MRGLSFRLLSYTWKFSSSKSYFEDFLLDTVPGVFTWNSNSFKFWLLIFSIKYENDFNILCYRLGEMLDTLFIGSFSSKSSS